MMRLRLRWILLFLGIANGLLFACAEPRGDDAPNASAAATSQAVGRIAAATDSDLYTADELGTAIFENSTMETVYLPGCAPFEFERSLAGLWVGIGPPFVCVWEGIAVAVGSNEFVETEFDAPRDSGIYRLRYDYGAGCDDGVPLSQANCMTASLIHSNEFEVVRELCDPGEQGCQFVPLAPNVLCADGVNFAGPAGECTRDPASGLCGYEFLSCP